jgi:hypothetical protein
VRELRIVGETTTRAALLAGFQVSVQERIEGAFDAVAYLMRYSKGGVSYREAMGMDGWELRHIGRAIERLVEAENGSGRGKDGGGPVDD